MKTPTKEQIELLKQNLEKNNNAILGSYWLDVIVREWEKIKSQSMSCKTCQHNNMGICDLNDKEIGLAYVMGRIQKAPNWCKLKKN